MRRLLAGAVLAALPAVATAAGFEAARAAYYGGDFAAAASDLKALVAGGDPRAETLLGLMYDHGDGVARDNLAAALLYRSAAAKGYFPARYLLGGMYARDPTTPEDAATTFARYRAAAEAGQPVAQYNLARAYGDGFGVARDPVRAYVWFALAAEGLPAGDPAEMARSSRAAADRQLSPAQRLEAQRLLEQWKSQHQ